MFLIFVDALCAWYTLLIDNGQLPSLIFTVTARSDRKTFTESKELRICEKGDAFDTRSIPIDVEKATPAKLEKLLTQRKPSTVDASKVFSPAANDTVVLLFFGYGLSGNFYLGRDPVLQLPQILASVTGHKMLVDFSF